MFETLSADLMGQRAGGTDSSSQAAAVDRNKCAIHVIGSVGGQKKRQRAEFGVLPNSSIGINFPPWKNCAAPSKTPGTMQLI